jgi:thiamine pyrophosphokinase
MRAVVVGACPEAGGDSFYRGLLAGYDLVVAADAGAEWCVGLGRVPDVAVGDFDSAAAGATERLRAAGSLVLEHPRAKVDSDLDLAVAAAIAQGASSLTLCACFGARLDHTLASVGTLVRAAVSATADAQEPSFAAWTLDAPSRARVELSIEPGATFSVLSIGVARGVCIAGGEFPLEDATLPALSSHGLSNVAAHPRIAISVGSGSAVLIVQVRPGGPRPALIVAP